MYLTGSLPTDGSHQKRKVADVTESKISELMAADARSRFGGS